METIRVPTAREQPSGEFIHDHHLAVVGDHVLVVPIVQRIGAEELRHGVNPVAPLCVEKVQLVLLALLLIDGQRLIGFNQGNFRSHIRNDEKILVIGTAGEDFPPLLGQIDRVILFIDRIIKLVVDLVHAGRLIAQVIHLRFLHQALIALLRKKFHQP